MLRFSAIDRDRVRLARSGLTLIEVLVSIAVIGLLAAVLTPAVQSVRESSRASTCSNHLQQFGKAIQSFEARQHAFPHALKVPLLDDLGLRTLAEMSPTRMFNGKARIDDPVAIAAMTEFSQESHSLFQCPSDPASSALVLGPFLVEAVAGSSYDGNSGTGLAQGGTNGIFDHDHARWYKERGVTVAEVYDGTSHTAAMSEILVGDGGMPGHRLRTTFHVPGAYSDAAGLLRLAEECDRIPLDPAAYGWLGSSDRGYPWHNGALGNGLYNHVLTPNRPSCTDRNGVAMGIHTAGSLHPGSIHTLFADGHVDRISETVDRNVWWDYGSRSSLIQPSL